MLEALAGADPTASPKDDAESHDAHTPATADSPCP